MRKFRLPRGLPCGADDRNDAAEETRGLAFAAALRHHSARINSRKKDRTMALAVADVIAELEESWEAMGIDPDMQELVTDPLRAFVKALPKEPDPDEAMEALTAVILALNAAVEEDEALIETDEREIIVPWLIEMAAEKGLDPDDFEDGDPTGDLREF